MANDRLWRFGGSLTERLVVSVALASSVVLTVEVFYGSAASDIGTLASVAALCFVFITVVDWARVA